MNALTPISLPARGAKKPIKVNASHETAIHRPYLIIARIVRIAMEENGCLTLCEVPEQCACRKIGVRMATSFSFDKRKSGRPVMEWTPEMVERLQRQHAEGVLLKDIAASLGVSDAQLDLQAKKLGLRRGRGGAR